MERSKKIELSVKILLMGYLICWVVYYIIPSITNKIVLYKQVINHSSVVSQLLFIHVFIWSLL